MESGIQRILHPGQSITKSYQYWKLGADASQARLLDINPQLMMTVGSVPIKYQKQIRCVTCII